MDATYLTSAQKAQQLKAFSYPEVAFIGRSNCGKSSLINLVTGRKNLARSSSTPGRTQMANFFELKKQGEDRIILADLPGYGFNVAKKDIQLLWNDLLDVYLKRSSLKFICYLFDARRQIEDFEWQFLDSLTKSAPVLAILTKCDKLSSRELENKIKSFSLTTTEKNIPLHSLLPVSCLKKQGQQELLDLFFAEGL